MYRYCLCCSSISPPLTPFIILRRKHTKLLYEMLTNVLGSLNPTISDISKTEYLCSMISLEAALLILILRITLIIESSLRSLIFLYKVGCDIFNRFGKHLHTKILISQIGFYDINYFLHEIIPLCFLRRLLQHQRFCINRFKCSLRRIRFSTLAFSISGLKGFII